MAMYSTVILHNSHGIFIHFSAKSLSRVIPVDTSPLKRYNNKGKSTSQRAGKRASGMNEKIQSVLNSLPHKPGIYLMKDAEGTIIYVGKAISLFNRVRSYFQESTDLSPKNRSMVARIEDIELLA